MEKCDFLLTYEVRNREIENICLLKYELERRGYSVLVKEQYRAFFDVPERIDAKVIVVPAYYRDRVRFYTASHSSKVEKIVNLQWEQMLAESRSNNKDALAAIKPWGYGAMHISWGEDDKDRLIKVYGVPENHVALTGHIGMDFLRKKLRGYYYSRKEICERYKIPENREIILFISSFSVTTMHDRFFEGASLSEEEKKRMYEYRNVSIQSQKTILEWFDSLLQEDKERILIYRPHPEERNSEILKHMQEKHDNFRVISDMSVKQWILTADKILTWASTSVVEVFFAEKTCLILNPLPLPEQMRMKLYENASVITSSEEFISAVNKKDISFPIPAEDIHKFYSVDDSRLSYELICDTLEEVLQNDDYKLTEPLTNPFNGFINKERVLCFIKRTVSKSKLCNMIHNRDMLKTSRLRKNIDDIIYVRDKLAKNHVTEKEMEDITDRIDLALSHGGKI